MREKYRIEDVDDWTLANEYLDANAEQFYSRCNRLGDEIKKRVDWGIPGATIEKWVTEKACK